MPNKRFTWEKTPLSMGLEKEQSPGSERPGVCDGLATFGPVKGPKCSSAELSREELACGST